MHKFNYLTSFIIGLALLLETGTHAFAQSALDISITPPTGYMKVKPGGQATHTVVIENSGDQTVVVTPRIVDFTTDGRSGSPVLAQSNSFPYFDFDSSELGTLTIKPKAKAQLSLHMVVPQDAVNREYPLSVLFESKPLDTVALEGAYAQVSGIIGSNLIILVSDETAPATDLSVDSFQTSKLADSFRPLTFKPMIKNNGYAASAASGSAQIKNWRGVTVQTFQVKPVVILGSSTRELEVESSELEGEKTFMYKPLFLLGLYRIDLQLESTNTETPQQISESETVFAFPIWLLVLIVISTTGFFIYTRYKSAKY